jgi:hypothetical protein
MANTTPSLTGAEKIQTTALEYILQAQDQLNEFLGNVSQAALDMREDVEQFSYLFDYASPALPTFRANEITSAPPAPTNVTISAGGFDSTLQQDAVPALVTGAEPGPFTKDAPSIGTYDFPDPLAALTAVEPTLNFENAPTLYDPESIPVPVISETYIPVMPIPEIPTLELDTELDVAIPVIPDFSYSEQMYTSELLQNTSTKLMYDMLNGGYGIEPADEQALWARAREREFRNLDANVQEIIRESAAKGFVAPTGAHSARIAEARRVATERMSDLSRDIATKRADMYVENRKFTIQESQKLEGLLSNIYGSYMERMLKAKTATIEMAAAVYSIKSAEFNSKVARLKVQADAYDTRLKAALAPIEAAKVRLEAAKLESGIKKDQIEIYTARVNAAAQFVNMQRLRLDAYVAKLQTEKSKLEMYKLQVEAYSARAQAKSTELQAYKARIEGDVARINGYESEVKAYGALVDVYKTRVQAKVAEVDSVVKSNAGKVQALEGRISAYKAGIEAQSLSAKAQIDVYRGRVDAWAKNAEIELQRRGQEYDYSKHEREVAIRKADARMKTAIEKYREIRESNTVLMQYNDKIASSMLQYMSGLFKQAVGISAEIKSLSGTSSAQTNP